MMTQDEGGYYLLCIPTETEVRQLSFDSVDAIHHWLLNSWDEYHEWLHETTHEVVQLDSLWIEFADEDGTRYRDAMVVIDPDTGRLEIN